MNMQRVLALLKKEFGQFAKDKKLLPIVFVAPVLQLIFLGFAASLDVKNISMLVCDLDKSQSSRAFIEKFTNTGYFTVEYSIEDYALIQEYIDNHSTTLAVVIPPHFGNKLLRHETARIQILLDGSEGNAAATTMGYVNQIIAQYANAILVEMIRGKANFGGVTAELRTWFNPSLKSRNYMVPAVIALILLITTTSLTSMAIVREKEIGTLEQIMVTPIRPSELILGKLIPYTMIGIVNVCVVLLVMVFGFGIPIKGSVPLLFLLTGCFLLTSLGLGLFVSTISRTQQQAMMTTFFFLLMPMMYLSGFAFPIENMPPLLQYISLGIPIRYFLTIVRSIILKGVGLSELWVEAGMLLLMGINILIFGMLRFHKKLD
jgi:ABC-2 type transport system permease protein